METNDPPADPPPANPTLPMSNEEMLEALLATQSRLTRMEQEQARRQGDPGTGPSRPYASALAADSWQEDAKKLEGVAKVVGRLNDGNTAVTPWLSSCGDAMSFYGVNSDADRVTTAAMLLQGKFQAYWSGRRRQIEADILSGVRDTVVSWAEICDELKRMWPEHGTPFHDARRALFDVKLKGTAVPEYTQRFTQLLAEANPAVDPLSATEVYLRALPAPLRSEVERVRPVTGWEPATALQRAQQELQRLYDCNIVHSLMRTQPGASNGSGTNSAGRANSQGGASQPKRKGSNLSLEAEQARVAKAAKVAKCMADKLCSHCDRPLATCGHMARDCPDNPKNKGDKGKASKG